MSAKKIKGFLTVTALWLVAASWSYSETPDKTSARTALEKNALIRVNIHQLVVDPANQQPVVSLSDLEKERAVLIWIGMPEAIAIYSELQGVEHDRPLTHDLLTGIIRKVNGKISRVVITHTDKNVYYAMIVIKRDGTVVEIDARPSDSIVMALKFKAPIFVSKKLFEKVSIPMQAQKGIEEKYGLTLQELTPELVQYLSFPSKNGVMVSDVQKGSRAEKDGIEKGDIILEVGKQTIDNAMVMKDVLANSKTPVAAKIFRKSRLLTITLRLR